MVSLVNRSTETELAVEVELGGTEPSSVRARMVHHDDPKAHNSWDRRDVIAPSDADVAQQGDGLALTLPALSLVTIELTLA